MEENLVFSLEGHCRMNSQRIGRHLAIGSTWDRDKNVFESIDFSCLRSLTVFGEWRSFFISDEMRLLRVLDLEDAKGVTEKDLEQMVKFLPRLKFLSLRGCRHISRLPDSFGDLRQLQTLDIRDTSITKLPKSISKLQKLQFIRAGTTVPLDDDTGTIETQPAAAESPSHASLVSWLSERCIRRRPAASQTCSVEVPRGIGRLTALHTLGVINISVARRKAILKELKNLTQLCWLGVSGINRNNSQEFFSAISGHSLLELLVLYFDNDNEGCLDGVSLPPENLRSLKLYGLVGKLPVWIKQLQNLRILNLQMTMLPQEEIDLLGGLPKLAILCISFEEFQDGELRFRTGLKPLHVLEITCNSRLQSVTFPTLGFSNLVALKLHCCSVSHLQVFGLRCLDSLKEVWLSGSYDEALLKRHLGSQLDGHPNKIRPVLREGPRWS
ncbi:disease resistance protein Pik-2-like [Phragmites australis]|uniref:disease resistance protein Pik-2-like n=1 Tax=Phragmites australis TaxID=29695 RepID=UPI002D791D64|nr:disease resistance protein Pik-2-like [Phragmites australis]